MQLIHTSHTSFLSHTLRCFFVRAGQSLTVALWPVRQWVTVFWGQRASTVRMDLVQRPSSQPFIHLVQFRSHTPSPGKKHNTTACVEWLVKWNLHHRFIHCIMFSLTFLVYILSIYISFRLDGFSEVCGHESQNPMCISMSFIVDHFNWINGVIFHTFICYNMECTKNGM